MPRQSSYWNVIPVKVTGAEDPHAVLKNWGIRPWGQKFGSLLIYVGWQRVSLPPGWQILLEEYSHLLVDDRNQVRGKIINAFRRVPDNSPFTQAITAALVKGTKKKGVPEKRVRPVPTLQLQTSLRLGSSFCLGDKGPYSYWVENALGERIHGIYDVEVSDKQAKKKLPQLVKQVEDWLNKKYPNWKSHDAYWDIFN